MRLVICAYHQIGYACLQRLLGDGDEIVAVITHRDSQNENVWFDSVADLARSSGIAVFYGEEMGGEGVGRLVESLRPDVLYSFYYRRLLPERALHAPRIGAFNLHGSLLPMYRGRCPVNWVILNQEKKTGVTLHHMVRRPDAGDIVSQREIIISPRETALTLYEKMTPIAASLVEESHPLIRDGRAPRLRQDESKATYFGGRRPEDGRIDWGKSAAAVDALVRAVTRPYPGAFTFWQDKKLYVWETAPVRRCRVSSSPGAAFRDSSGALLVSCGEGHVAIVRCQLEGKEEQTGRSLAAEVGTGCFLDAPPRRQ